MEEDKVKRLPNFEFVVRFQQINVEYGNYLSISKASRNFLLLWRHEK